MKNLWRLLKLYKPYSGWVLLGIFLSCITLLANISLMAISGWFIASMAIAGVAGVSMNYYSPAALIRAAAIFRTAGRYAERLVTHEATFRFLSGLRVWFYTRLEPLIPSALEDMRSGDLLSNIRTDIETLNNLYIRVIVPVSVAIIGVILTSWVMAGYSLLLAQLLLLMLLISGVFLPYIIARLGAKPGQDIVQQSAELNAQVVDAVQGLAELSVCGALDDSYAQVSATSRGTINAQVKMGYVSGLAQSGLLLMMHLTQWLVLILAIPMTQTADISGAELAMLVLFSLAAFESVMPLPEAFRLLGQVQAAADRLFRVIDRTVPVSEPVQAAVKPTEFDLQFRQVSFRYQQHLDWVLKDINLHLKSARKIAIVGPTGAGKSSLIPLMLHYREPESGEILMGARQLAEYTSKQLHDWIAVVPQQVYLFNATIRDNLLLANPQADDDALSRVCRLAQLNDFIQQQPEGLDTWVGETGVKVSGGQARRIAIARALLRDFDCLVLDEPGEGLDSKTEQSLISGLVSELSGQCILLITHSKTGINLMDEIVEFTL